MDDERAIVEAVMDMFRKLRLMKEGSVNAALARYLDIIPDSTLQGMAQHMIRQHLKKRTEKTPLNDTEKGELSAQIGALILNDLIKNIRKKTTTETREMDGAELFYRRALNHIGMERYSDAERLLRRSIEICPDFIDGWDVLVEVLEHNGKLELAEQARLRLRELKMQI